MARRTPNLAVDTVEDEDPSVQATINRMAPKGVQMLDRSRRDVGELTGNPYVVGRDENGEDLVAHYTQPDRWGVLRYFDGEGMRLKREGEPPDGSRPTSNGVKVSRAAPVDRAILRQMAEDQETGEHQPGEPLIVGDINLTAWMLQKERYPFTLVRKAVQDRYSKVCQTEIEAFDFLYAQGIVTAEQLRAAGVKLSNDP